MLNPWIAVNYYDVITNYCIAQFHRGNIPWRIGTNVPFGAFACNYQSGHTYQGINWLLLNLFAPATVPYYMTKRGIQRKGGSVLEGARARQVYSSKTYYKDPSGNILSAVEAQQRERNGDPFDRVNYLKEHRLYRVDQTQGINYEAPKPIVIECPEHLREQMVSPPKRAYHDGTLAHYDPATDTIVLPDGAEQQEDFPYVLCVQLIHATGHEKRCNRPAITQNGLDTGYDLEEHCIADIGASLLARVLGVPLDSVLRPGDEDPVSFWIQALEEDNRFLFRVALQAQQAVYAIAPYL